MQPCVWMQGEETRGGVTEKKTKEYQAPWGWPVHGGPGLGQASGRSYSVGNKNLST